MIREILKSAENSIKSAKKLLDEIEAPTEESRGDNKSIQEKAAHLSVMEGGKIVEGVFDGQNMIGPDGRNYPIPANYASKSKLVEGDILKLTISDDGTFVFKQIGPVDRKKAIGQVVKGDNGDYRVFVGDKSYKVLMASVTYFKAEPSDEVTIILPRDKESTWTAIENIIKKTEGATTESFTETEKDVEEEFKPVNMESDEDEFEEIGIEKPKKKSTKKNNLDEVLDKEI